MNPELELLDQRIAAARTPEDLFGALTGSADTQLKTARALFRKLARVVHTDLYHSAEDQGIANRAFARLAELWKACQDRIADGTYGKAVASKVTKEQPITIHAPGGITYVLESGFAAGDVSNIYMGSGTNVGGRLLFKMASDPGNNIFLKAEALTLRALNQAAAGTQAYQRFVPHMVDALVTTHTPTKTKRMLNVTTYVEGYVSLVDVFAQYPRGIDARHFVWMWRRLLCILDFVHAQGVIHGAVLPEHVLVHPVNHGAHLIDWCFTQVINKTMIAVPRKREGWYPPEVIMKKPVTPATDIYMAAQCMAYLLGVDPGESFAGRDIHPKFRHMLEACLIHNPARRVNDAWKLYRDFSDAATEVFGKRQYVPLTMSQTGV